MAFIETSSTVYSFAEYSDVTERDDRLFVTNEGLTQTVVEDFLTRSTERILSQLRSTDWWTEYFLSQDGGNTSVRTKGDIPALDPTKILARKKDFTDLCVYHTMYEYLLPRVADFGDEANEEKQKIGFYHQKYTELFMELVRAGDWYDFDDDATIQSSEKDPGKIRLRRVR